MTLEDVETANNIVKELDTIELAEAELVDLEKDPQLVTGHQSKGKFYDVTDMEGAAMVASVKLERTTRKAELMAQLEAL